VVLVVVALLVKTVFLLVEMRVLVGLMEEEVPVVVMVPRPKEAVMVVVVP
jgi:hypothetical protein